MTRSTETAEDMIPIAHQASPAFHTIRPPEQAARSAPS